MPRGIIQRGNHVFVKCKRVGNTRDFAGATANEDVTEYVRNLAQVGRLTEGVYDTALNEASDA